MLTGSPTLHRRLPSLCMQARSLGYSTVWANRAGSQSTNKLRHCCLSLGWDGFPSEPVILLDHLNQSSSNLIIQGWVKRSVTHHRSSTHSNRPTPCRRAAQRIDEGAGVASRPTCCIYYCELWRRDFKRFFPFGLISRASACRYRYGPPHSIGFRDRC